MPEIEKYSEKTFEDIKHINADGIEFWYARELQTVLEYSEWRNFLKVIEKSKKSSSDTILMVIIEKSVFENPLLVFKSHLYDER